jgi:hypothetical protein
MAMKPESALRSRINDPRASREERIEALTAWAEEYASPGGLNGGGPGGPGGGNDGGSGNGPALREVNNHIHTIYSFSPYTPAMAALRSWEAGLGAAGSVDHDSAAAAEEMIRACAVLGIGGCSGFEVRVRLTAAGGIPPGGPAGGGSRGGPAKGGPFADRKINNPDSPGIVYMTVQGIPGPALPKVGEFLKPIREERLVRTRAMAENTNVILREAALGEIDFDREVRGASAFDQGGGITERHLLAALADLLIRASGKGPGLIRVLENRLKIAAPGKIAALLGDDENPHYRYDLLGLLKTGFLPRVFIQPGERECIPAGDVTAFANAVGAIPAYAYLGDVGESPTGDKKAEKFEDDFLEPLFEELSRLHYRAVTYMPPRNTEAQLRRVQRLCRE